jgi:hypothetical protein
LSAGQHSFGGFRGLVALRWLIAMNIAQRKTLRVLFDEWHSESWSCSRVRAAEIQPEDPTGASYQRAADALSLRDFTVERNDSGTAFSRGAGRCRCAGTPPPVRSAVGTDHFPEFSSARA